MSATRRSCRTAFAWRSHETARPCCFRTHSARYGGEAGTEEGLAQLARVAATLPKDREVVIYCGCCPRSDCPNIRPAYTKLKALGLRVKVLDMPSNFRHDWQDKGFPVEK